MRHDSHFQRAKTRAPLSRCGGQHDGSAGQSYNCCFEVSSARNVGRNRARSLLTTKSALADDCCMIRQLPTELGEACWVSERGELYVRRPTPLVLLYVEKGFLEVGFAPLIIQAMEETLRSCEGKPYFFVDCEFMEGYEPEIRTSATNFIAEHRSRVSRQHMLVKSRLVKMGLAVTSMMLGGLIVGHYERPPFEAALADAIAATRRETSAPAESFAP